MKRGRGSACLSLAPLTPPCSLPNPSWMCVLPFCLLPCPALPSSEPLVLPAIVSPVLPSIVPLYCLLLCPMLPFAVPPMLPSAVPYAAFCCAHCAAFCCALCCLCCAPCAAFCCALCYLLLCPPVLPSAVPYSAFCHSHPCCRLLCPVLALICLLPLNNRKTSNPMFLPVLFVRADVWSACVYRSKHRSNNPVQHSLASTYICCA